FSPFPVVATVRLLNRESGEVEPLVCRNLDEAEWRINKKRTPSGRAKRICETKASLVVRNIQTDPQTFNQEVYRQCGLVSFLGYIGLLKDGMMGEVNKQQENALEKLLACAVDEINMINTIILTTQIEARTITREYRSLELSDLLDHLRSTYKVQTDKKDVKLT